MTRGFLIQTLLSQTLSASDWIFTLLISDHASLSVVQWSQYSIWLAYHILSLSVNLFVPWGSLAMWMFQWSDYCNPGRTSTSILAGFIILNLFSIWNRFLFLTSARLPSWSASLISGWVLIKRVLMDIQRSFLWTGGLLESSWPLSRCRRSWMTTASFVSWGYASSGRLLFGFERSRVWVDRTWSEGMIDEWQVWGLLLRIWPVCCSWVRVSTLSWVVVAWMRWRRHGGCCRRESWSRCVVEAHHVRVWMDWTIHETWGWGHMLSKSTLIHHCSAHWRWMIIWWSGDHQSLWL